MAENWATNVKMYVPDADDGIIAGIVRYCGIALQKRDSSLVSFGDPAETRRVRDSFLKKKLALTDSDEKLDATIAEVGKRMKGEKFRNRVTVYYLLAEQFGKLQIFAKATKAPAATKKAAGTTKAAAGAAAPAGLASLGASEAKAKASKAKPAKAADAVAGAAGAVASGAVASAKAVGEKAADAAGAVVKGAKAVGETAADAVGAVASGAKAVGETAAGAAGVAGAAVAGAAGAAAAKVGSAASAAGSGVNSAAQALKGGLTDDNEEGGSGLSWLIWLALIAVVLGVLWWLFYGKPAASTGSSVTTEQSAAATGTEAAAAAAPAEGTVAIPTGAGVTTETRDGKPVVKVYFDTGKTAIVPAFAAAASGLKGYLDGHAGSTLAISGYNDKTGNAAANAALSKSRAQAVQAALVTSGIADAAAKLAKPAETTDSKVDDEAARRVEVVVQ